jgi:ATP-binding cassette, subfamily B, heavy metal transporter
VGLLISDNIVVLDEGVVAESGSHADLLDKDGHYAKMWREQRAAEQNEQNG